MADDDLSEDLSEDAREHLNRIKVRTITRFTDSLFDPNTFDEQLQQHAEFLRRAQHAFSELGVEVQTLRLATSLLLAHPSREEEEEGEETSSPPLSIDDYIQRAKQLERSALKHGIAFLSLGAMHPELADRCATTDHGHLTALASSLTNTSFSLPWQPHWGRQEARRIAVEILRMAESDAQGVNFRFAVAFNCPPGIPFFPCAAAADGVSGFALGTENNRLLHHAFKSLPPSKEHRGLEEAKASMRRCFEAALQPLETIAEKLHETTGVPYLGIDASVVPGIHGPSIPSAFEHLGLGPFGGLGTLALAEATTSVLKSLPLRLTGYTGLMLPVAEDRGLARAAEKGNITVQSLLQYSAVCGVGLDTVPVPGLPDTRNIPQTMESEVCGRSDGGSLANGTSRNMGDERAIGSGNSIVHKVAALLLDVAALSKRLGGKPLSVRLLPVPHADPGDDTHFGNPYLIETKVMQL